MRCSISSNSVSAPRADRGPSPPPARGPIWQPLLGVAVSIGFLVWALWGVKFADVLQQMRHANPLWYLLSCAAAFLTFPVRAIRWRIMLRSSTSERRFQPYWRAVCIGFMANNVLPARAGEVVRSYAGTELIGVPFTTALASVAVERVFDGVVLVLLLALAVVLPGFPAGATLKSTSISALAATMAVVFVGALVFLIILVRNRDRALPIAERLIRKVTPARLGPLVIRILENLVAGLGVLQSLRDISLVILWSFAVWLANALSYLLAFHAFGVDVPAGAALLLPSIVAFGVAVPSSPGFFGVFEEISKLVLGKYGIAGTTAITFAIGIHLGWFIPITIIGLVLLARSGLSLHSLRTGARVAQATPAP
ncbi:MAG TPA: lysylphosphatidylglycerol synthase transmembrane domain-containing protein [Gemmatimonadales bacterium]|jgi:hypothetical protein